MKKSILLIVISLTAIYSCKKEADPTSGGSLSYPIAISMTDAPGSYDAVLIDLQAVEVTGSGQSVILNTNAGIYNLLSFSNGADTLIASASLTGNSVEQIRLILGPNNTVVVNGVSHPLSTPSAEQSGLKLQVHKTLQPGILYSVLLDFDANQSIVQMGNGGYKLKPVIRTIETAISGAIKGKISPAGTFANVSATSSANVSYYSNVVPSGEFLIMGLSPGIYTVTINPGLPFSLVTLNNITVSNGITTNLGVITL